MIWLLLLIDFHFHGVRSLPQPTPTERQPTNFFEEVATAIEEAEKLKLATAASLADGISTEQMKYAYPSRERAGIKNWYGTSLFGWNGCGDHDVTWRGKIIEAYQDANKLVNYKEVAEKIDFNSAAALQFLGPSGLNEDQQAGIQRVFNNVATIKKGGALWTPNWIRVRCDDPLNLCTRHDEDPDDPKCPPVSAQGEEQAIEAAAYTRNPYEQGNDKYSEINFCPTYFKLRNLDNAMAHGEASNHPILKADLRKYEGRADIFLHELLHLDLAANSKNENPNPHVRDLLIKFKIGSGADRGKTTVWTKVYGPRLAKILASFQPFRQDQPLGYFIQRSDDSYSMFALARYVQKLYGFYPYLPMIYDQMAEMPLIPPRDQNDSPSLVAYGKSDTEAVAFFGFTQEGDGRCSSIYDDGSGEDLEIGAPIDRSLYPVSYWEQYDQWMQEVKNASSIDDKSSGTCQFSVSQKWTCEASEHNLYAGITLFNAAGKQIYKTPESTASPGVPTNNGDSWHLRADGMKNNLTIAGEHENHMRFSYNHQEWRTSDTEGTPSCHLKSKDWPESGPECPGMALTRQYECSFRC